MDRIAAWLHAQDQGMLYGFERLHHPWVDAFMKNVTYLGDRQVVGLLAALGFLLFAAAGRWTPAIILVAAVVLSGVLSDKGKRLATRARPDVSWRLEAIPSSDSFPSGHATLAMGLYGTLAVLTLRRTPSRALRCFLFLEGFGLAGLVGVSRCYLGVHYPLDVLAGWTAGLACVLLAAWADSRWGVRATALPPPHLPIPPAPPSAKPHDSPSDRPPAQGIRYNA